MRVHSGWPDGMSGQWLAAQIEVAANAKGGGDVDAVCGAGVHLERLARVCARVVAGARAFAARADRINPVAIKPSSTTDRRINLTRNQRGERGREMVAARGDIETEGVRIRGGRSASISAGAIHGCSARRARCERGHDDTVHHTAGWAGRTGHLTLV